MKNKHPLKKSAVKFRYTFCFAALFAVSTMSIASGTNAWQPAEMPRFNIAGLARPMATSTLQLLFNEAESAYRSKRTAQAAETLQGLIELEPAAAAAWFRLGNIWQSQGQTQWAIFAYEQASKNEAVTLPAEPADIRQKALLNLVALHLRGSRAALDLIQSESALPANLAAAANRVTDELEVQTEQANHAKQALVDMAARATAAAPLKASVTKPSKQKWMPARATLSTQATSTQATSTQALSTQTLGAQTTISEQKVQVFSGQTR